MHSLVCNKLSLSEPFLILGRNERYIVINVHRSICKLPYSCHIVMKSEFSRHIYEKYLNIKFSENPSSGSRVVPCGQTDRREETNSRFSQFCERAWKEFVYKFDVILTVHRR